MLVVCSCEYCELRLLIYECSVSSMDEQVCYLILQISYLTQDHVINAVTAVVVADLSVFQLNVCR